LRDLYSTFARIGAVTDNATLRSLYFDLLSRLQPDVCCDIGAHDGQAALVAKEVAPGSEVYAFEANPEVYQRHRPHLENVGVHYLNLAINERSGEATVYAPCTLSKAWDNGNIVDASITEPADTGKASLLHRSEAATYREFTVASRSLDDFFATKVRDFRACRFALWIDVEGATELVLLGAETVLRTTVAIFVELEGYPFWKEQRTADRVIEFLMERGFLPVARDREYGDDQFNVLFVRTADRDALDDLVRRPRMYPLRDVPVLIPVFNNPTYLRKMIEQLRVVGLPNIIVVDNGSEYPPFLDYLDSLEGKLSVVRLKENSGPRRLFRDAALYNQLPQYFCLTDPDLGFNPNLPSDFVERLADLTTRYHVGKAGFSLDISEPEKMIAAPFQIGEERCSIWEWEAQFWQARLEEKGDPAYRASIDTTFAVYNKEFFCAENFLDAIRVAGCYTARHLPWYADHRLPPEEADFYRATSKHSFYTGTPPKS
jgi:FkbM family methyltransferase